MTATNQNYILELKDIQKEYIVGQPILNHVNFTVMPGDIVAITEDNGTGKSTLLRIIAGLDSSYTGTIKYRGKTYTKPTTDIILLHQSYEQLFPWLTVEQNIIQPIQISKKISHKKAIAIAHSVLNSVGIKEYLFNRYPFQLSGGQKQKISLARALALSADILLMDEPFSALDETSRYSFQQMLKSITEKEKKTILLVSHSAEEVNRLTDKIIHLERR